MSSPAASRPSNRFGVENSRARLSLLEKQLSQGSAGAASARSPFDRPEAELSARGDIAAAPSLPAASRADTPPPSHIDTPSTSPEASAAAHRHSPPTMWIGARSMLTQAEAAVQTRCVANKQSAFRGTARDGSSGQGALQPRMDLATRQAARDPKVCRNNRPQGEGAGG